MRIINIREKAFRNMRTGRVVNQHQAQRHQQLMIAIRKSQQQKQKERDPLAP